MFLNCIAWRSDAFSGGFIASLPRLCQPSSMAILIAWPTDSHTRLSRGSFQYVRMSIACTVSGDFKPQRKLSKKSSSAWESKGFCSAGCSSFAAAARTAVKRKQDASLTYPKVCREGSSWLMKGFRCFMNPPNSSVAKWRLTRPLLTGSFSDIFWLHSSGAFPCSVLSTFCKEKSPLVICRLRMSESRKPLFSVQKS